MTLAELIAKHPLLQNVQCGVSVGDGWVPLLDRLFMRIESHVQFNPTPVVVGQVKEKFGGLRVYFDESDDFVNGLGTMAESVSWMICEDCGARGELRCGGWIRTLCDACETASKRRRS